MKYLCFGFVFVLLILQSCRSPVVETPTPEQPSPALPASSPEQPSPIPPTLTPETLIASQTPTLESPAGFKQYQDSVVGVSIFVPESWVMIEVDPGRLTILQSYPEDKYIGGEAF